MHYYNYHIILVSLITSIFIYYRKLDYYKVIPRENILVSLAIGLWTYVSFKYSVWFVIVGLVILNLFNRIY